MEYLKIDPRHFISPSFSKLKGVKHAFFTRNLPLSSHAYVGHTFDRLQLKGSKEETLQKNKGIIQDLSPFRMKHLSILNQTHSNRCIVTDPSQRGEVQADGQATQIPGMALAVLTADCVPVLFADEQNKIIGSAHAGWRGAIDGVLENTVLEMVNLGSKSSQISAVIGPCIRQESYEVGSEFVEKFLDASKESLTFFKPGKIPGKMLFDLPGYVSDRLNKAGLKQVYDTGLNTCTDDTHFFSYRASTLEGKVLQGNLVSVVMLD